MSFQEHEKLHIEKNVKRELTSTELQILAAEWSEHCSYKSSKMHLKNLPTKSKKVIQGPGENHNKTCENGRQGLYKRWSFTWTPKNIEIFCLRTPWGPV